MRVFRVNDQTIGLGPIPPLLASLLHQIRPSANPEGDDVALARFFPAPTAGADEEFDQDWQEYIRPDLAERFTGSLDIIEKDLAGFPPEEAPSTDASGQPFGPILLLPVSHIPAWILGLNQARLAIATRYRFSEAEMNYDEMTEGDVRALALLQVDFYGSLLEGFVRFADEI
jgi:hypothetical protein